MTTGILASRKFCFCISTLRAPRSPSAAALDACSAHACVQHRRPNACGHVLRGTRGRPVLRQVSHLCVSCRFAQVTLDEVLGRRPPRAFEGMAEAERERLFWDLKTRTTALRGQQVLDEQTPPVRFGPNRDQTAQARPVRRARVLSSEDRRARLAQQGQPAAAPSPAQPASPPPAASQPPTSSPQPCPPPASSQPPCPPPVSPQPQSSAAMEWFSCLSSAAQSPCPPPAASSQQPCHASMEWVSCPSPQPTATMSPPSLQSIKPPLFPPRPQVFCIPASPPPPIPSRLFKFSFPFFPPPFPARTSLFSLTSPPPIPPRPFIFSVGHLGIPPRPYFISGECVPVGPAIPDRLFFLSGQCVSYFLLPSLF